MCSYEPQQSPAAGVNVLAENDTPSFILVNAIFLLGTFTFAVVLGVVSDDIGNELKARLHPLSVNPCRRRDSQPVIQDRTLAISAVAWLPHRLTSELSSVK